MTQETPPEHKPYSVIKTIVKLVLAAILIYLLWGFFAVIEWSAVFDGIANLSVRAWVGLILITIIWVVSESLVLASVLPGLRIRNAVQAFLAPTAAASIIPGPADLVARFAMYDSWGFTKEQTSVSITASFFFVTGAKVSLPIFGALALWWYGRLGSEVPDLNTVALIAAAILIGAVIILTIVLRSAELAHAIGRWIGTTAHRLAKPFRIQVEQDLTEALATTLVNFQSSAGQLMKRVWWKAALAALFAQFMQFLILLTALRGVGITSEILNTAEIFAAFSLVQIITAIPISPGGLGITEAAYITFLVAESDPDMAELVTAGTLIYRLFSWILIIPAGGMVWLWWNRNQPTNSQTPTNTNRI